MTSSVPAFSFDHLLQHENFVRKALRGLLRDQSRIDDAIQETWLRALQSPGAPPTEPRAWFARVARNLSISSWRSERRRQRREAAATPAGDIESPEASRRRIEMRQRVVAAVLALDEPYRSVVVLRYEQDLEAAAIAQRLGRSAATVRSQLSRAHDLLRQRLDRDFGSRERWLALAAPLLPARAAPAGALAAVSLVVLAIGLAGWAAWVLGADEPAPAAVVASAKSVRSAADGETASAAAAPSRPVALARQDATPAQDPQPGERILPAAELRDRAWFDDYEAATFSFEHGVRDDPDLSITHNDWDLELDHDQFLVNMVTDDHSAIADLGAIGPRDFGSLRGDGWTFAATARVVAGHAYFVATLDSDTDLATVVFVRAHEAGRTCRFDWYTTDGTDRAQGSLVDERTGRPWCQVLADMRAARFRGRELSQPWTLLQMRGGAIGGNPCRIDLAGEANAYVKEVRAARIDVSTPAVNDEPWLAHCEGGMVPPGTQLVVTRADYSGGNLGDSNGSGPFRIAVAGQTIVSVPPSATPVAGSWSGRIAIRPGEESATWLELSNSSWGEVRLAGEFVSGDGSRGFGGRNAGFWRDTPLPKIAAVPWLERPFVFLQVRAASGGGNPNRVDLRGRTSLSVEHRSDAPLDFDKPLAGERSVCHAEGGTVPDGCRFVVTHVKYSGANQDQARSGGFRLVVAGEMLVNVPGRSEPVAGEWSGRLEIVPGEESRTWIEVADQSQVEAVLTGHFESR